MLRHKKGAWVCLLIAFLSISVVSSIPAGSKEDNYDFSFTLPVPQDNADRAYLGLMKGEQFSLSQVKSPIILIEIFSMYCPICQGEAGNVNTLFNLIQSDEALKKNIRMIGIGAGNSQFEADFFKSNYKIEFPLFSDPDYVIHKKVGEVGTPHFFGLKIVNGKDVELFFSHSGRIPEPEKILESLRQASGMEFK